MTSTFCVRWLKWLANSTHLLAAKVTKLCVSNLISNTFLIYWRKYNFCFLFCLCQNSWYLWIFTSPLCGQGNIHHYWPPLQWINVKYQSNACQIEIVKYVQSTGIELFLLISIWLSLRNLQIHGFTTFVLFKAHSVISYQTTSRKNYPPRGEGEGIEFFEHLQHFTFKKIFDKMLFFLFVRLMFL